MREAALLLPWDPPARSHWIVSLQERLAYWRDDAGFGAAALQRMLNRFPRLLLFNMAEPRHQAKLEFLKGTLGQPLSCLETYPQVGGPARGYCSGCWDRFAGPGYKQANLYELGPASRWLV